MTPPEKPLTILQSEIFELKSIEFKELNVLNYKTYRDKNERCVALKSAKLPAFLILFVLVFNAYSVMALEGIIIEIRIEGNRRVSDETIKSYLTSKVGERYYPEKVTQDIKNIYARGFFSDVRVEGEQTKRGIILIYYVEEKPLVKSVKFTGNDKITDEDIQKVITVKEHQVLNMTEVKETEKAILEVYQKQGFYLAEVSHEIEKTADGQVNVTFKIAENQRVLVKQVIFLGNEAFSDEELLKHVITRPADAITFLTQKGYFQEEEFKLDVERLTYFYLDNGYIKVQIAPPQVFISPDKKYITVIFKITEGPQFFVGKLDIKGDLIRPKEELLAKLSLKEGDVYSALKLKQDVDRLSDYYADFGYADANVMPQPTVNEEERKVDITFVIDKGGKVYIERIDITGNYKTRDMVIRRQLKIKEGQLYSASAIKRSERNVMRLGFFKQVKIISSIGSSHDKRRLTVIVEETTTGTLSAGAGYSSTEDFILTGQISQDNLFGRGQSLSLSLFWGQETQNFNITFRDPYLLDTRWTFTVNAYVYLREYVDYSRKDAGGSVTLGHYLPRSDYTRLFFSYQWQDTELSNFSSSRSILNRIPLDTTTSSVTIGFNRNTTNNYLDPTDGSELYGSIEFAGSYLGGENDFTKYTLRYSYFQPIWKGTYFNFRTRLGILDHNQGNRLLVTERYYLGGIYDLRGFENRTIGPTYPSGDPNYRDIIIGGNKELVFSLDYIIPIVKSMGIKWVFFVDAGNSFNDDEPFDLSNLRYDWGFGIRWMSPMGPLRFEFGFPIDRKEGEERRVFQFAIGTPLR